MSEFFVESEVLEDAAPDSWEVLHTRSINSLLEEESLVFDGGDSDYDDYCCSDAEVPSAAARKQQKSLLQQPQQQREFDDNNQIMAGATCMSISDLFNLNSPRGLLGSAFGGSPAAPTTNYQMDVEDQKMQNYGFATARTVQKKTPLLQPNAFPSRTFRSTSLSSDSCGSSSPAITDTSLIGGYTGTSRSDSPESDNNSAISYTDNNSFTDLFNSLTLNDGLNRNLMGAAADVDQFANLQALQALKYLQQPPSFNSLFQSVAPQQVLQNSLDLVSLAEQVRENLQLERAARFYKSATSACTWSGVLPARTTKPTGYSSKVFLGGVPWDISEQLLVQTFKQFGQIKVDWPGREKNAVQPKGHVYIILESEHNVMGLLQACTNDFTNRGNWYYKISSRRMKSKEVQVIPWILNDSNHTESTSQKLDPSKTVFVGGLHGMLSAKGLATVMNDLFGGVVYAGIDTDKYKYPIGSGRVTFDNQRSYLKAIAAAFIEIRTAKFTKKVQVKPYLEDSLCSICSLQQGPYFCREMTCFRYFCLSCWQWQHAQHQELRNHMPLTRNSKGHNLQHMNLPTTKTNGF